MHEVLLIWCPLHQKSTSHIDTLVGIVLDEAIVLYDYLCENISSKFPSPISDSLGMFSLVIFTNFVVAFGVTRKRLVTATVFFEGLLWGRKSAPFPCLRS